MAVSISEDAVLVAHEALRVREHGNSHRPDGNQLLQSVVAHVIFFLLVFVEKMRPSINRLAFFLGRLVLERIVIFLYNAFFFGKEVGIEHPAATAAEVGVVTVD